MCRTSLSLRLDEPISKRATLFGHAGLILFGHAGHAGHSPNQSFRLLFTLPMHVYLDDDGDADAGYDDDGDGDAGRVSIERGTCLYTTNVFP